MPRPTGLRGAARLATDATIGLTDLVEALHERIARLPGLPASGDRPGRTAGITGLVYQSVRGVTRLVGGSADALLGLLAPTLERAFPADSNTDGTQAEREAVQAALNGVLGDHLVASGNPLAITMEWRVQGKPLDGLAYPVGGRLLLMVHGLCMNDRQWLRQGHDHGAALARDLGFTPLYLRYNSGLHVSVNARQMAAQLEQLLQSWPQPLQRLVIVGHSMGGLVARSAVHHGLLAGHTWPSRLDDLVCLGTPHHGAPLERAGNWVDVLLAATPYSAPFARLGQVRSSGITDLRHGLLLDEDWQGQDRFARLAHPARTVPLPTGTRCWAAAGQLTGSAGRLGGWRHRVLGDGLVPLSSALGQHADPGRRPGFDADRQWVAKDCGHLDLLSSPAVYAWLRDALGQGA